MFLCLWFLFLVVLRLFLVTSGISSIGILVRVCVELRCLGWYKLEFCGF